jgi:hypothetical protein
MPCHASASLLIAGVTLCVQAGGGQHATAPPLNSYNVVGRLMSGRCHYDASDTEARTFQCVLGCCQVTVDPMRSGKLPSTTFVYPLPCLIDTSRSACAEVDELPCGVIRTLAQAGEDEPTLCKCSMGCCTVMACRGTSMPDIIAPMAMPCLVCSPPPVSTRSCCADNFSPGYDSSLDTTHTASTSSDVSLVSSCSSSSMTSDACSSMACYVESSTNTVGIRVPDKDQAAKVNKLLNFMSAVRLSHLVRACAQCVQSPYHQHAAHVCVSSLCVSRPHPCLCNPRGAVAIQRLCL